MATDQGATLVVILSRAIQTSLLSLLLVLLAVVFSPLSHAKSLTASVDRNAVDLLERFTLQLKADDIVILSAPDFSSLAKDFNVLNKNVNQSMQNINGVSSESVTWQVTLEAKKVGKLIIPAFSLAGEQSEPIEIAVKKASVTKQGNSNFDLQLYANKLNAKPNEQIIVTLKFSFSKNVSNLQSTELALGNAQVIRLDDNSYEYSQNGKAFGAYEISYAVFASNTGALEIPAQKISVRLGRSSMFNNRSGDRISLQSKPLKIPISALDNKTNGPLLVADSLSLQEDWLQKTETIELGSSLTREINLLITGALAKTIPSLQISEMENIKIYPEPAQKTEQKTSNGLVTKRSRSFAIIPTAIGKYTLPEIKIMWWNALEEKIMTAVLPEKKLQVIAPATALKITPIETENRPDDSQKTVIKEVLKFEKVTVVNPINQWLIALNLVLLSVVAMLVFHLYRRSKSASKSDLGVIETDETEAVLFKALLRAVKHSTEADIHRALMRWSQHLQILVWQLPHLEENISQLEQLLYANDNVTNGWQKSSFADQLTQQRKIQLATAKQDKVNPRQGRVPTLYPTEKPVSI